MGSEKVLVGSSDRESLQRAVDGDGSAFADIYDRHVRGVYLYALKMMGAAAEAEDATQDAFILAWNKRRQIRIVDESVLPWLLVATRNLCLNKIKHRSRRDRYLDEADFASTAGGVDTESTARARMVMEAIDDAVGELSLSDQTLYYLCIEEGLSYKQAAASIGESHGAVRNRLARLRGVLRLRLADQKESLS